MSALQNITLNIHLMELWKPDCQFPVVAIKCL